jgi:hypothetical protein
MKMILIQLLGPSDEGSVLLPWKWEERTETIDVEGSLLPTCARPPLSAPQTLRLMVDFLDQFPQ